MKAYCAKDGKKLIAGCEGCLKCNTNDICVEFNEGMESCDRQRERLRERMRDIERRKADGQ